MSSPAVPVSKAERYGREVSAGATIFGRRAIPADRRAQAAPNGATGAGRFPVHRRALTRVLSAAILSLNDPCEPTARNGLSDRL